MLGFSFGFGKGINWGLTCGYCNYSSNYFFSYSNYFFYLYEFIIFIVKNINNNSIIKKQIDSISISYQFSFIFILMSKLSKINKLLFLEYNIFIVYYRILSYKLLLINNIYLNIVYIEILIY